MAKANAVEAAATGKAIVVTRATLKQSGGSLIFTVPAPARKAMDFKPGDEIEVTVGNGRMIVEPAPVLRMRLKYSLDDLLAQCAPEAGISDDERAWLDEPPVGREFW